MSRFIIRNMSFTVMAAAALFLGPPLVQQCGSGEVETRSFDAASATLTKIPFFVHARDDVDQSFDIGLRFRLTGCLSGHSYNYLDAFSESLEVLEGDHQCRVELVEVILDDEVLNAKEPFTDYNEGDHGTYVSSDPEKAQVAITVLSQISSPALSTDTVIYSIVVTIGGETGETSQIAETLGSEETPDSIIIPEPDEPSDEEFLLVSSSTVRFRNPKKKTKAYNYYKYGRVWWVRSSSDEERYICQTIANRLAILDGDIPVSSENGYSSSSCYALNEAIEIDQSPYNPKGSQQLARDLQVRVLANIDSRELEEHQLNAYIRLVRKSEQIYRKYSRLLRKQAEIDHLEANMVSGYSFAELQEFSGKQRKDRGLEDDYRAFKRVERVGRRCAKIKKAISKNMNQANQLRFSLGASLLANDLNL